jgi:hypothetical protein
MQSYDQCRLARAGIVVFGSKRSHEVLDHIFGSKSGCMPFEFTIFADKRNEVNEQPHGISPVRRAATPIKSIFH